jgi:hypothetical protein
MREKNVIFQDVGTELRRFGESREQYWEYIEDGIKNKAVKEFIEAIRRSNEAREDVRNAGCWVIGDPDFVRKALESDQNRRHRIARYQKEGWDVSRLAAVITERLGLQPLELQQRKKEPNSGDAQKIFCYIGSKVLEIPQLEIGRYIGISIPAVWKTASLGKR